MVAISPIPTDPTLAWEVLRFFPRQGQWTAEEYFLVNRLTNHFIELKAGRIEVLEMPTKQHQDISFEFARRLKEYGKSTGRGKAVIAPYPVYLTETTYREPDVIFVLNEHLSWLNDDYAFSADLVVEVLSQERNRDLVTKREDYARAGIREYWIVDPAQQKITVLKLVAGQYVTHQETSRPDDPAASALLDQFQLSFAELNSD